MKLNISQERYSKKRGNQERTGYGKDITDIPAWYLYGVGRITIVRRGICSFVDEAVVVPLDVQGVLVRCASVFQSDKD